MAISSSSCTSFSYLRRASLTSGREKYTSPNCGRYIAGIHISGGITHQDTAIPKYTLEFKQTANKGQTAGSAADASVFRTFCSILTMFRQLITRETLENQLSEESLIRLVLNCRGGWSSCRGGDQGDRDHPPAIIRYLTCNSRRHVKACTRPISTHQEI